MRFGKKLIQLVLFISIILSLSACGKDTGAWGENDNAYVYVPQYVTLNEEEESYLANISIQGNRLYYMKENYGEGSITATYYYRDLTDIEAEPVEVLDDSCLPVYKMEDDNTITSMYGIIPCEDGVILVAGTTPLMDAINDESAYRKQMEQTTYSMYKLATDGTEIFCTDITEQIKLDMERPYLQYMCCDGNGNIFISNGQSYVWVYDKDGNHLTDVVFPGNDGWISSMGAIGDGRVAILQNVGDQMQLLVYNEKVKGFSETYDGLPANCWNSEIVASDKGVLLHNNIGLYEYEPESKSYTEVLQWLDCDINADYIETVSRIEEDSYLVYISDWGTGESGLVILKKTVASEVTEKEVITLACMSQSQYLQSLVINFNKINEQYRVEVIDYSASVDWSSVDAETSYKDAVNRFNSDIITGNGADMFCTNDIDVEMLAMKGVIEDLTPYLENSSIVEREDLFESVLDAYTMNGILCGIPSSFSVNTLAGRTAEVGEESGWNLEEMIAYAKEYPEADILPYANKLTILYYCVLFDFDSWVNWEEGECYFDTPEFKQVLEFANSYEEADMVEDSVSEPVQLRNHDLLLYPMDLSDPYSWQVSEKMFGEDITAIGFPSSSTNGVMVYGNEAISISSSSDKKEVAWSFIEMTLTEEAQTDEMFRWGFPIRISVYQDMMEEAMIPNYLYDGNGEILLDDNGDAVELSNYSCGWEDFMIEVYSISQEEADKTWETIQRIDGVYVYNEQLMAILEEESALYFAGEKTVDEVADIIQNRIQLYVDENR